MDTPTLPDSNPGTWFPPLRYRIPYNVLVTLHPEALHKSNHGYNSNENNSTVVWVLYSVELAGPPSHSSRWVILLYLSCS